MFINLYISYHLVLQLDVPWLTQNYTNRPLPEGGGLVFSFLVLFFSLGDLRRKSVLCEALDGNSGVPH